MTEETDKGDLDVFVHAPISRKPVIESAFRVAVPNYATDATTSLQDLLAGLAAMVVELAEFPITYPAPDPDMCRRQLLRLRTVLDHLYPSSVWPDDTTQIGGSFAWAIRKRIAERLGELE